MRVIRKAKGPTIEAICVGEVYAVGGNVFMAVMLQDSGRHEDMQAVHLETGQLRELHDIEERVELLDVVCIERGATEKKQ
jgi:hypothetical protein